MNEARVVLVFAIAATLAFAATPPTVSAQASDCIDCSLCAVHGVTGHKTMEGDSTSIYDEESEQGTHDGFHDCVTDVFCDSHGGACDLPDFAWIQALYAAVASEGEGAIEWLNSIEEARWAMYAPDRRAIQVRGCGDQVIAHFPLSDSGDASAAAIAIDGPAPAPF